MRLAIPLAVAALAAALLAGCGGSSSTDGESSGGSSSQTESAPSGASKAPIGAAVQNCVTDSKGTGASVADSATDAPALRANGVSCGEARRVMYGWQSRRACSGPAGASRTSCEAHGYRCLGARTDRGIVVSCSRPGRSVAFVAAKPG